MTGGLDPTEEYDGSVTVRLFDDDGSRERIQCPSYRKAIDVVKEEQESTTVVDIVDRDGAVVYTSDEMNIDNWEREWEQAKRSISVDVEEYDCPHDNVACFADDLCVQCKLDKVQNS